MQVDLTRQINEMSLKAKAEAPRPSAVVALPQLASWQPMAGRRSSMISSIGHLRDSEAPLHIQHKNRET